MAHYHISDHLDLRGLTNRYHCREKLKVTGGEYKQLLGIRQHLKQEHKGKMLTNAKVRGLTNRYHCREKLKVTGGEYKQLLGIRQHLKQEHKGKMLTNAKVHILTDSEMRYESSDKFKEDEREKQLTGKEVNRIVRESGEVLVVE